MRSPRGWSDHRDELNWIQDFTFWLRDESLSPSGPGEADFAASNRISFQLAAPRSDTRRGKGYPLRQLRHIPPHSGRARPADREYQA
jgi:hypothetical protein